MISKVKAIECKIAEEGAMTIQSKTKKLAGQKMRFKKKDVFFGFRTKGLRAIRYLSSDTHQSPEIQEIYPNQYNNNFGLWVS